VIYFVTVNYYSSDLIAQLLDSIQASETICYRIVIVNNSPENAAIYPLENDKVVILETGKNLGFGNGCNLGLNWIYSQDSQAIVWIINPDTYLLSDTLDKVPDFFVAHPHLSIVGTIVYTTTGEVWFSGGKFFPKTGAILSETCSKEKTETAYLESDWVSGCSVLLNFKNFLECPQFDPNYFLYYEDFDFCRRYAEQGHLIAIANHLAVVHQPSSITNRNQDTKFKHSTYAYLFTLKRYASQWTFIWRLIRIILHAFILTPIKPQVAFGKLHGVWLYFRRSLRECL
jgi:N-acetylglucosaminyl-diphospho-decaprenol L-rhamnosyltransferase